MDDFVNRQKSQLSSTSLGLKDVPGFEDKEPTKPDVTENINKVTQPVKQYTVEPYLGDRPGRQPKPAKQFAFEDVKARAARPAASTPAAGAKDISFLLQNTPSATPVRRRRGGRPARRGFIPPTRNYGGGHHGR